MSRVISVRGRGGLTAAAAVGAAVLALAELAGGFTHAAGDPGSGVVAVLLRYS